MLFPDGAHFDNIHNALYQELVKDVFLPETRDKFRAAIRDLTDRGAEAVILGCTEFGLLVKPEDCAVPLIDTTHVPTQWRRSSAPWPEIRYPDAKMPQAAACGIFGLFGMLQRVFSGLKADDLVHRQRDDDAVRVRAQAAGVADGVHDGGLFLARRDDDDELLFLLHGDAELAADALGVLAASMASLLYPLLSATQMAV